MGHERIGFLPRSKRWREIVADIAGVPAGGVTAAARIAEKTLNSVSDRFGQLHEDQGIQAAFGYVIALATSHLPPTGGLASPEKGLEGNPSPARIVKQLKEWVREHRGSPEYAELACRAASDTIAEWTRAHSCQRLLFDDSSTASSVWAQASSGKGFCEVSRLFFAHFTQRYLRYFLEREASAQLPSIDARARFNQNLETHLNAVSKHAFETSKITQSFAAGWFNKHARERRPSDTEIRSFLAIAFGKVHEELQREAAP